MYTDVLLHVVLFKGSNYVVIDTVIIALLISSTHICMLLFSARDLS